MASSTKIYFKENIYMLNNWIVKEWHGNGVDLVELKRPISFTLGPITNTYGNLYYQDYEVNFPLLSDYNYTSVIFCSALVADQWCWTTLKSTEALKAKAIVRIWRSIKFTESIPNCWLQVNCVMKLEKK